MRKNLPSLARSMILVLLCLVGEGTISGKIMLAQEVDYNRINHISFGYGLNNLLPESNLFHSLSIELISSRNQRPSSVGFSIAGGGNLDAQFPEDEIYSIRRFSFDASTRFPFRKQFVNSYSFGALFGFNIYYSRDQRFDSFFWSESREDLQGSLERSAGCESCAPIHIRSWDNSLYSDNPIFSASLMHAENGLDLGGRTGLYANYFWNGLVFNLDMTLSRLISGGFHWGPHFRLGWILSRG